MAQKGPRAIRPVPAKDAEPAKKAKQEDLPGMDERKIPDLHAAAEHYAAIRDQRMGLTEREVKAKDAVLALMKKHGKTEYRFRDGTEMVEITVVPEGETVKVRVKEVED